VPSWGGGRGRVCVACLGRHRLLFNYVPTASARSQSRGVVEFSGTWSADQKLPAILSRTADSHGGQWIGNGRAMPMAGALCAVAWGSQCTGGEAPQVRVAQQAPHTPPCHHHLPIYMHIIFKFKILYYYQTALASRVLAVLVRGTPVDPPTLPTWWPSWQSPNVATRGAW
jgi:hypothetical protein